MHWEETLLYPGITLRCLEAWQEETVDLGWKPRPDTLVIHYCLSGRMGWDMPGGNRIYLGAGDFCLNTMELCANSPVSLPNGDYRGLAILIDRKSLAENPPQALANAGITGEGLLKKYCPAGRCAVFAAEKNVEQIFETFFTAPPEIRLTSRRIKLLELLLVLSSTNGGREKNLTEYRSEQVELIRQIHDQLTGNLERRYSIDALSRQYLMNPTTLKQMFKTVYGTSIAAHIREHRMESAAQLLANTDLSIADIAQKVGYDSQSRFSSAFKEYYHMLPKEYRRKCAKNEITPDVSTLDR